jgi:hypothetical protein
MSVIVYSLSFFNNVSHNINPIRFDLICSSFEGCPKLLVTMYCDVITSGVLSSASPTFFPRGTFLASQNNHGPSHPC